MHTDLEQKEETINEGKTLLVKEVEDSIEIENKNIVTKVLKVEMYWLGDNEDMTNVFMQVVKMTYRILPQNPLVVPFRHLLQGHHIGMSS